MTNIGFSRVEMSINQDGDRIELRLAKQDKPPQSRGDNTIRTYLTIPQARDMRNVLDHLISVSERRAKANQAALVAKIELDRIVRQAKKKE